ncbi:MAG TPA: PEP-CTERM sorting domain-containing protein [Myxococcota bacterium]|nr:PEP-CTERM sorting domain-containing protein [Myxococcota bacterium]
MRQTRALCVLVAILLPSLSHATTVQGGDVVVSGSGIDATGLLRVDAITGAQTLIAAGNFGDFSFRGTDTIYALSAGSVVRVDVASGSQQVVSSGGSFVTPSGIAVSEDGRIFVSDYDALGGDGAIFEIDRVTGAQSVLTSAGFLLDNSPFPYSGTDLEIGPGGDLILLDPGSPGLVGGDVWSVDVTSGLQTILYLDPGCCTAGSTGLGVALNGDIYVSNGADLNTLVLKIDAISLEPTIVGTIRIGDPAQAVYLFNTDIAIGADGTGFMTGTPGGLHPWNGSPLLNPDGSFFSNGTFNEVQIAPVPEPGSAALLGMGCLYIALFRRRRRR